MHNKNSFLAYVSSHKSPLIVGAVTVLVLLLFINKPFHVDDPLFIWTAKNIQQYPADFYGFMVNWYGVDAPMFMVMQNPPLACYYIAMTGALFGYSEVVLHAAFILPAIFAAVGIYCLAQLS